MNASYYSGALQPGVGDGVRVEGFISAGSVEIGRLTF